MSTETMNFSIRKNKTISHIIYVTLKNLTIKIAAVLKLRKIVEIFRGVAKLG